MRSLAAAEAAGADCLVLQQFRSERTLEAGYAAGRGYPDEVLLDWAEKLSRLVPTRVRGLVGAAR
jgi:hypothetical protein